MKKTLAVLMTLLLLAMLIVSCNADSPVIIHKVTFDADNGSEAKVEAVIDGEKTVKPYEPEKTGYTFLGWYDGATLFDFDTPVKKDYELKAKWQILTFTVSFSANGGEGNYESQTINYGAKVDTTKVQNPTRTGCTFLGWYDGESNVDLTTLTVTKNYELKAKWNIPTYTVSFNPDGGTPNSYESKTVECGNTIEASAVANPTKTGYTFDGWYNENDKFEFGTTAVTGDITLKAKWNINSYTVTFDSDDGTPTYNPQSVEYNNTTTSPGTPKKDECNFMGWYNGSEKFDFDKPITENINLKAKWGFTVTFDSDEGSSVASQDIEENGTVKEPANPIKEGQVFVGWYDGDNKFDFNTKITKATDLKAKWRNSYAVEFRVYNNGSYTLFGVKTNNGEGKVEAPTDKPTKTGYIFDYWSTTSLGIEAFDFTNTEINGNITLYAIFRNYYKVGDIGPAGGTIIYDAGSEQTLSSYVNENGETVEYKWRYLEAASEDVSGGYTWGPNGSFGTGQGIGSGWKNMVIFMDEVDGLDNFPAAKACDEYSVTVGSVTYDDWFLPSLDELFLMADENYKPIIEGIQEAEYFSSTEYRDGSAWVQDFGTGSFWHMSNRSHAKCVRPVRAFVTWNKTNPPTSTATKYTVTFDVNGGTGTFDPQTVADGRKAKKPATNPMKDDCIFTKWTTDSDGKNEYNFGDAVTENITLYAQWAGVGDTVNLGTYDNGSAVSWKVLAIDNTNKRALLISENILEQSRKFGSSSSYSGSSMQSYLNGNFIKNHGLSGVDMCNVDVSLETTTVGSGSDKVFLLSATEAQQYFKTDDARKATYNNGSWPWWLRTAGSDGNYVYCVFDNGGVTGNQYLCTNTIGLRPAFWMNL